MSRPVADSRARESLREARNYLEGIASHAARLALSIDTASYDQLSQLGVDEAREALFALLVNVAMAADHVAAATKAVTEDGAT